MLRTIKQSTLEERKIVIKNYLEGKTQREIANIVNKSKSTVHDIIKRYNDDKRISNKQRAAVEKKLSQRDEKFIIREVQKNPFISAPKLTAIIKNNFGKDVHAETVRRVLRKNDLNGRVARKKPCISEKNRKDRLEFAREHISKDFSFWRTVKLNMLTLSLSNSIIHRYFLRTKANLICLGPMDDDMFGVSVTKNFVTKTPERQLSTEAYQ